MAPNTVASIDFESVSNFASSDELLAAKDRMIVEGWESLPWNRPDLGVVGFAFMKPGKGSVLLNWLPYGRELKPDVVVMASWKEFADELRLRQDEDMEKSDNPGDRQVGFVSYARASGPSGRSEVFRIGIDVLKAGGEEARNVLLAILEGTKYFKKL